MESNGTEHVMDEFDVYRNRAHSLTGRFLLDVKHTSIGIASQPQSLLGNPKLMSINDSCSDDSIAPVVTCSSSPKGNDMVSRQQRRSTLPIFLRKSQKKRCKARKASCPEVQLDNKKLQHFGYEKNVTIPCGKATRVETCGNDGESQKHKVRLTSEGSIEKSGIQHLKTVNLMVNSKGYAVHGSTRQAEASRTGRSSLPNNLLHTARRSRTPSPSSNSKSSLLQNKSRRPSEPPMGNHLSPIRPRTRSMPSRSRTSKSQQSRSLKVAEGYPAGGDYRHRSNMNTGDDLETEAMYRVRSFSTSGKTVVNRGDSFKSCTTSSGHASICDSTCSITVDDSYYNQSRTSSVSSADDRSDCSSYNIPPQMYKVLMLGTHGVGKSSLAQQFTTSEYMGHVETLPGKSVQLCKYHLLVKDATVCI